MKLTIEGTDDECREAVFTLALGFEERMRQQARNFEDNLRTQAAAREVRERCKTDACRLPASHPDHRSDP